MPGINISDITIPFGGSSFDWAAYWAGQDWGNYDCRLKTINANKDALIFVINPTYNYGVSTTLQVGETKTGAGRVLRSCVDFDFSSINDDHILSNVKLHLYHSAKSADNNSTLQVFRFKKSWAEGTGNGSATGDGVTWNTRDGINNWTTPGGFDSADCEQIPIGTLALAYDVGDGWKTVTLNVTSKDELTLGYGFLIKVDGELDDSHTFNSSEGANVPYITCELQGVLNGTVSPLLIKSGTNPIIDGCFGSIVYEGVNQYSYYYCKIGKRWIYKRSSTDGITWGAESVVYTGALGSELEVCSAWIESGVTYCLYRSDEWSGTREIGLLRDFVAEPTNPVITHADIGAWCTGAIDPWGIIKIGAIYYLWVNDVSEVPRQTGLMTSTDLVNWTPNANNPIFDNGRFCSCVIKYNDNYYLFIDYTPLGITGIANPLYYRIEIYRDTQPTFLSGSREYLGSVLIGGEDTEWDDQMLDTPSILTGTIERNTFPIGDDENGRLYMYYCGYSGTLWKQGLATGHLEMLEQLSAITEPAAGE